MANDALPLALVTLPDNRFFLWQMLVHWAWQEAAGYPTRYLLYTGRPGKPSAELAAILDAMKARDTVANASVWPDWRVNPQYNPAMKPGLVGAWLKAEPSYVDKPLLLLDPDALPLPRFVRAAGTLDPSAWKWFGTDTDSYTGPAYLKSKGEDLWVRLCQLARVDPDQAGAIPGSGSQWVFTGHAGDLWTEIAHLSEQAYPILVDHSSDVQTWCAEMYITQLVLIREGIDVERRASMRMIWAGDAKAGWSKAGFYHNAGVQEPGTGHFHKGTWQTKAPFFAPLDDVRSDSASAKYVEAIRHTEETFPELCRILA